MQNNKNAHRKRGVRASRAKLTAALTRAGLRTQAALAERIADLEGLDAAPRDAVSRLFRELPVEATTLARAARALGVEPHILYLTSAEERPGEVPAPTPVRAAERAEPPARAPAEGAAAAPAPPPSRRRLAVSSVPLALLLLFAVAGWFVWPRDGREPGRQDTQAPILDLGNPMLVVMPIEGGSGDALGDALREALGRDFRVATKTASVLTRELDARGAANRLRSDVIVEGEIVTVGRLVGLRFFGFVNDARHQVWAESMPAVALPESLDGVAGNVARAVRQIAGMARDVGPVPHFPPAAAQDDYLWGEYYLDRPSNELNIRRAQNRFEAALRQDPDYARAFAGLCRALLEEHWMSDEERALKSAARACGNALKLAPGDPVVNAAHAHFLRLTGRSDEAIALYEKVVAEAPRDSVALGGLAYSLQAAYLRGGDRGLLVRAKEVARQAADTDPVAWKPLFWLAGMEWFDGNVEAAIAASEAARARDENEYVLANLGTFYLCGGAIPEARDAYLRAQEVAPQSYVGDEFLGTAYYFLGDFAESARLRQRAIDSIAEGEPEIHQMWGNLADSLYQLGRVDDAVAAYLRAAEIAERDQLRGNAPVGDRAARAYYYTMLGRLDPKLVPASVAKSIDDELDGIAAAINDANAHRRMAQIYLLRGEHEEARAALERSMAICPGYGQLPDLAALNTPPPR